MVSRERYRGFYDEVPGSAVLMGRQIKDSPARDFLSTQSGLFAGIQPHEKLYSLPGFNRTTTEPAAVQHASVYMNLRWSLAQQRHAAEAAYKGYMAERHAANKKHFTDSVAEKRAENAAATRVRALRNARVEAYKSEAKGIALKTARTALKPETAAVSAPVLAQIDTMRKDADALNRRVYEQSKLPPGQPVRVAPGQDLVADY